MFLVDRKEVFNLQNIVGSYRIEDNGNLVFKIKGSLLNNIDSLLLI